MQIYMCHHDTHPQSNRTVNQSQPLAFVHKFAWGMFEYQNIVIESNAAGIKFDTQRHRHLWISALGCRFHSCHGEGIWWKFVLKHLRPRMAHKINAIHSLGHVSTISFTTVSIYYMKWTPLQNVTWSNVAFGMEQLLFFCLLWNIDTDKCDQASIISASPWAGMAASRVLGVFRHDLAQVDKQGLARRRWIRPFWATKQPAVQHFATWFCLDLWEYQTDVNIAEKLERINNKLTGNKRSHHSESLVLPRAKGPKSRMQEQKFWRQICRVPLPLCTTASNPQARHKMKIFTACTQHRNCVAVLHQWDERERCSSTSQRNTMKGMW